MIPKIQKIYEDKRVVFEQIRKQIPFFANNKTRSDRKKESEQLALEKASQLITEKKYKRALKLINETVDNGISTNQILFKKASILAQLKRYEEANVIWQRLSELKNKPKLAASAKQSLQTSKIIKDERIQSTKHLIRILHANAKKYQQKLNHLPKPKDWSTEVDIIPLICKEAELARTAELPKLSADLIDQTLRAGLESALLIHDKALSLGMMGQLSTALELLEDLSQEIKNPEIKELIGRGKEKLHSNANHYNLKKIFYLVKQARIVLSTSSIEPKLIPEDASACTEQETKSLIFNEAINCFNKSPEASLWLVNSILDYYPGDGASLQFKGEVLAALKRNREAIQTWNKLAHSEDKEIANKASQAISRAITQMALHTSSLKSPEEAISLFIREHLRLKLAPTFNKELNAILEQLESSNTDFSDPELEQQQLQLVFNTQVIGYLEAQLSEQGRLNASALGQHAGATGKTAPKAG